GGGLQQGKPGSGGRASHLLLQNVNGEENRRENIIEIVRNSTGKSSNRLQPLRPKEMGLAPFLLRNVGIECENGLWETSLVRDKPPSDIHDDFSARLSDLSKFALPFALSEHFSPGLAANNRVFAQQIRSIAPGHLLSRPAVKTLGAFVPI